MDNIYDYYYDCMDVLVMYFDGYCILFLRYYKDKIFIVEEKVDLYEVV